MERIITDADLAKARKLLAAERKILVALRGAKPEHRLRILKAVAILHGIAPA